MTYSVILLTLLLSCYAIEFTFQGGDWDFATSWSPATPCANPQCFPGGAARSPPDVAKLYSGTTTLNTKDSIKTGSFEIEIASTLTLQTFDGGSQTIQKVTVKNGELKIDSKDSSKHPIINQLVLGGKLNFLSSDFLTVNNILTFQAGASLAGGGTLNIPQSPMEIANNLSVPSGVTLSRGDIQLKSCTLMNDGSFNNVKITVAQDATFHHTGSYSLSNNFSPFLVIGTLNILNDMNSDSFLTSTAGGLINVASTSNPIDVKFSGYEFSGDTQIQCAGNPITFTNSIRVLKNLTITGSKACKVSLEVEPSIDLDELISIEDAELSLLIDSQSIDIKNSLNILGTGRLVMKNTNTFIRLSDPASVLHIQDQASLGTPTRVSPVAKNSQLIISTSSPLTINYVNADTGFLKVNGTDSQVKFEGSDTITTTQEWVLERCQYTNFDQKLDIIANMAVGCPVTFSEATVLWRVLFISGTVTVKDDFEAKAGSNILLSDGTIDFDALGSGLKILDNVQVVTGKSGTINITAGTLELLGQRTYSFSSLTINIKSKDGKLDIRSGVTIIGSISLSNSGSLNCEEGCRLSFEGDGNPKSQLQVAKGTIRCARNGNLNFQNATLDLTTIDGTVIIEDNCNALFSSSDFSSLGTSTVQDNGSISLIRSTFSILGSASQFYDDSTLILEQQSSFLVDGGDVYISDNSNITISSQSILEVAKGTLYQEDDSLIYIRSTGSLQVLGTLKQTSNAFIEITGAQFNISGLLESRNDTNITLQGSQGFISSSGNAGFYDNFTLFLMDSSFELEGGNGQLSQYNDSAVIIQTRGILKVNGNYTLDQNSSLSTTSSSIEVSGGIMKLSGSSSAQLNDTIFVVSNGGVLVDAYSNFEFDADSYIRIVNGYFNVTGNSVFSAAPTSTIDVDFGEFTFGGYVETTLDDITFTVGGNVLLTNSADVTFTNTNITVTTFFAKEDSQLSIDGSIISMATGGVSVSGSLLSELTISNSNITVDFGNFNVSGSTTPTFTNVILHILNGDSNFSGDAASLWTNSSLTTILGDIIFDSNADVALACSNITVSGGLVAFRDNVDVTFNCGSIVVTLGSILFSGAGNYNFDYGIVDLSVGSITFNSTASIDFDNTNITVHSGNLHFEDSINGSLNNLNVLVELGSVVMNDQVDISFNNAPLSVQAGAVTLLGDANISLVSSPLLMIAGFNGFFATYNNTLLELIDSPLSVLGGNIEMHDSSLLSILTPASTVLVSGSLQLFETADIDAVPGASITVSNGILSVNDEVDLDWNRISITVNGTVILDDSSNVSLLSSILNINDGLFSITGSNQFLATNTNIVIADGTLSLTERSSTTLIDSTTTISGGSFVARNDTSFQATNGVILITGSESDMLFYGSNLSEHTFTGSVVTITGGGNLETFEEAFPQFVSTVVTIAGGFVRAHDDSGLLLSDTTLSVIGTGTLSTYNNTHVIARDESSISVDSDGAFVSFEQNSLVEFFENSTLNVTDGSVSVQDDAILNLWAETQFNVLGGSFIVRDDSSLTAYPGTTGTIYGGNLFVSHNAALTFIQSEIEILGAISSNSTIPVLFLSNTTLVVNGGGVTVSDVGVIVINTTTSMHVLEGNVSLLDTACLIADNSTLKVSGGSILVKNSSCIQILHESEARVEGGNITTYDYARFLIDTKSTVLVTATTRTSGSVYITGSSTMDIKNQSNLFVVGGNLEISEHSIVTSSTLSTIRVVNGDLQIYDYTQFYSNPNTLVEVLAEGNFLASGPGVVATFSSSTTRVRGGDFSSEVRSIIRASDSSFEISNNGNVVLTDLTRTFFSNNTELNILGGGSLFMFREANLFVNTSSITVDNGGDVALTEKCSIELLEHSALAVVDGGSISFEEFASLYVSNASTMQVRGGGDITFIGSTTAYLQGESSLAVFNSGSIMFSESSSVVIKTGSDLLVKDGGNIQFNENAFLTSTESALTVLGGGSILFSGNRTNSVSQRSNFYVDGGNIEYNQDVVLLFSGSTFRIVSGDLKSYENAVFVMESASRGFISGGDFILANSSNVDITESSSLEISAGNVELYQRGVLTIVNSTVLVTGDGSKTGYFKTSDSVVLSIASGLIRVNGGDFQTSRSANVSSADSDILVTGGSARFTDSTVFYAKRSTVSVSGGDLQISNSTSWTLVENSLAAVLGGSLLLSGESETLLDHSNFQVAAGNCELSGSSNLTMKFSGLSVSGGDLVYLGNSVHRGEQSAYLLTGGQIIHDNFSLFSIVRSNVTVNRNAEGPRIVAPISDDDLIVVGGSSSFSASEKSVINVLRGNFIFVDSASSTILDSVVNVLGGDIQFDNRAVTTFTRTNTTISAGGFTVSGSSSLTVSDAVVTITGGYFSMNGSPTFRLTSSVMNITSGSARVNGGFFNVGTSRLALSGSGVLSFSGSSQALITSSSISLNNSSNLDFSGSSSASVVSSTFLIRSGSFRTTGSSSLNFLTSQFTISGGNTTFGGNSVVTITTSNFTVTAGNVAFAENSRVSILAGSTYSLLGGNVITSGSSVLSIAASCFTLASGSVNYGGSSRITLQDSCWILKGGNVFFNNNSRYSLAASSLLRIENGSFVASGSVGISIDNSDAVVIGGDLIAQVSSTLSLTNSAMIDVIEGNALFSGFTATVTDSTFSVSGGFVRFEGTSTLTWLQSSLQVSSGDLIVTGVSNVSFSASSVLVSGGAIQFSGASEVSVLNTELSVNIGSIKFGGDASVLFRTSSVNVLSGDIQFAEATNVSFYSTPIFVAGQMEFLGTVNTYFESSDITILSGNMHFSEQSNAHFLACKITIGGGLTAKNEADVLVEDSAVTIEDGDLSLLDTGSFSVHRTTVSIISGNLIASNADDNRKYISFTDSQINIYDSHTRSLAGNFVAHGNVEVSLLQSDVFVDGNMILTGSAKLNIQQSSSFIIPKGVVIMEKTSNIELDESSVLLNEGQLFAPGELRAPGSASVTNRGRMEASHDFNSNCFADMSERAPLINENTAAFSLQGSVDRRLQSCIDNLQHSGFMSLGNSNVTFNVIDTEPESVITLDDSSIALSAGSPFTSRGSLGGRGSFGGRFENRGTGVIMASGETGTTNLDIDGDFESTGSIFFMINSRDLSDPDALTQLRSTQRVSFTGGRACVCLNPLLELEIGDRWDLVTAGSLLEGRFESIELDCAECPRRSAKSIEGSESECEPVADYGTRSFSVLFESCDGGSGNYLEAITPPWYVIFPVSVTIIIVLVVCFGGALFAERVFRKRKFQKKVRSKRDGRVKKMMSSNRSSNSSQTESL